MARGSFVKNYLSKIGKDLKSLAPGLTETMENIPGSVNRAALAVGRPLNSVGRGLNRVGSSKAGVMGVAAAAGTAGMLSETVPAAQDAMFESAFGDPNADRYFTGRDLSSRFLVGSMMGGVGGGLLQASAPDDFIAANPVAGAAAVGVGGVGGAVAGGVLGSAFSRGFRGTVIGGAIGATATLANRLSSNAEFYSQSPYSSSASTAASLNATGDIVLGMHNSRRGY